MSRREEESTFDGDVNGGHSTQIGLDFMAFASTQASDVVTGRTIGSHRSQTASLVTSHTCLEFFHYSFT